METKGTKRELQLLDDRDKYIPILDQDYWNDGRANFSTEKTLADVSNIPQNHPTVVEISQQIKDIRHKIYKHDTFKKSYPIKIDEAKVDFTNPHFILKEGIMLKKTDQFFFPWHERHMVLTCEKLYGFQDERKEKIISCVNLKIMHADLKKTSQGLMLDFKGQCENLLLKALSMSQQLQWKILLQEVINYHSKQNKLMLKTMNKFLYNNKDTLTQKQFLKSADTGDILLFYTENIGAKIQRFFTNSDFDHVAMVFKSKNGELMVFECNQIHGVSMYHWKEYVNYFDLFGKVTLRKFNYVRKAEAQATLMQFMKKNFGKKYDLNAFKLLKFESDFNWQSVKQDRGYFCSELIAKALKSVGLLDQKRSSGRYWPADFAEKSELKLKKGANYGPEQTVILNKHVKNNCEM